MSDVLTSIAFDQADLFPRASDRFTTFDATVAQAASRGAVDTAAEAYDLTTGDMVKAAIDASILLQVQAGQHLAQMTLGGEVLPFQARTLARPSLRERLLYRSTEIPAPAATLNIAA